MRAGHVVGGRYRLEERLGSGSQGEVWRAADERLHDRPVALKRALSGGDRAAAAKVRKESEALASLNHPHVVTVHDLVEDKGDHWIVMEFVAGSSLADLGTVGADAAARYGAQLAGGLEAVHAEGILHRDIKPANVLVTEQGQAKLADFGIARQVHAEPTLTGTGAVTGTPGYVAPEVVRGGRYTAAADVFSLGATLFHAVEGTTPFGEGNAHALLWRTAQGDRVAPKQAGSLEPVLDRLLEADPKRRIGIGEAQAALARLSGEPVSGRARKPMRRRWIGAAAAASALVVLAAVLWPALRPAESGGEPGGDPGGGVAADYLGDERTADPCALLDLDRLGEFGETRLDSDYGGWPHCNVFIDTEVGYTNVELYFYSSEQEPDPGETTMEGPIGVIRYEGDHAGCKRNLVLPDGRDIVSIEATQDESGDADLCAIADTAVEGALAVLAEGEVPGARSRPTPPRPTTSTPATCSTTKRWNASRASTPTPPTAPSATGGATGTRPPAPTRSTSASTSTSRPPPRSTTSSTSPGARPSSGATTGASTRASSRSSTGSTPASTATAPPSPRTSASRSSATRRPRRTTCATWRPTWPGRSPRPSPTPDPGVVPNGACEGGREETGGRDD
nr:hypothetical protein GCM10025732_28010 [Glycomyces mayteni]